MIWDFMTNPFQGALFRKFRDQNMGVIPAQDPGPGKSHPGKAQTGKAQPGKGASQRKARNNFLKFGPAGGSTTGVCWEKLKQTKRTDTHTCNPLMLHVHKIVIRLASGCISIYQLLIETIFILPNSLLPFNLEENSFMNEYY